MEGCLVPVVPLIAAHLISLYLVLERDFDAKRATRAMQRIANSPQNFVWLYLPESLGQVTVLDVRGAKDLAEHTELVEGWARSVWSPHHETVRLSCLQYGLKQIRSRYSSLSWA
jgi:hypothetical protein